MADEEEIEIEGTEEIVPDELGPDDLADVEGEIDPEELLEAEPRCPGGRSVNYRRGFDDCTDRCCQI